MWNFFAMPNIKPCFAAGAFVTALLAGCGSDSPLEPGADSEPTPALGPRGEPFPPTAVLPTYENLRADLDAARHASDGGGRVWLSEDSQREVRISSPGTWTLIYEAGPLGVSQGGAVYFEVPPFWGWSEPQARAPEARGYVEVSTEADGVEFESYQVAGSLLAINILGRSLKAGEQIRIVYGAGSAGAIADRYAERGSPFWIAVDGDGDGVRSVIAGDPPTVDVLPGPAHRLILTLPSVAAVGENVRLNIAAVDARGNAGPPWEGSVVFVDPPEGLGLPAGMELGPDSHASIEFVVPQASVQRLSARFEPQLPGAPEDLSFESNPMLVSAQPRRIYWADLHGHSSLSDGTGLPEDYYRYARDVAALDIAALTDHDHWGVRFIDQHPDMWEQIKAVTKRFHEPERFVTLLGYEWTSWIYGHRHVIYFADDGELYSSMDERYEHPLDLWDALSGSEALTFAHHSAGGPVATDWSIAPDPRFEPVTEIISVHGSSEAADSPARIRASVPGNFVRDVLDRGYQFGLIGSGDSHDGHPGLAHLASPTGGIAAILADECTRDSVLEALRARRVYATSGARIVLRTSLAGHRMGEAFTAESLGGKPAELRIHIVGTAPLASVEVVRSGTIYAGMEGGDQGEVIANLDLEDLQAGEYVYVRVIQSDNGMAWSSPFFIQ